MNRTLQQTLRLSGYPRRTERLAISVADSASAPPGSGLQTVGKVVTAASAAPQTPPEQEPPKRLNTNNPPTRHPANRKAPSPLIRSQPVFVFATAGSETALHLTPPSPKHGPPRPPARRPSATRAPHIESVPEESVTSEAETVDVLGVGPRKKAGGAGSDVVASVAEPAAEQVRVGGTQQLAKHLLQDTLEAEMDERARRWECPRAPTPPHPAAPRRNRLRGGDVGRRRG
jgi:hypothetical protein